MIPEGTYVARLGESVFYSAEPSAPCASAWVAKLLTIGAGRSAGCDGGSGFLMPLRNCVTPRSTCCNRAWKALTASISLGIRIERIDAPCTAERPRPRRAEAPLPASPACRPWASFRFISASACGSTPEFVLSVGQLLSQSVSQRGAQLVSEFVRY
jgi:hypothetical protein